MEPTNLADLVKLDDSALIAWRREARTELQRDPGPALQAVYDGTTREVTARAREAWTTGGGAA